MRMGKRKRGGWEDKTTSNKIVKHINFLALYSQMKIIKFEGG